MSRTLCITVVTICVLAGCARSSTTPEILVPHEAFDTAQMQPSDREHGVKFHVTVDSDSYVVVEDVRHQLRDAGYEKCEKSAISEWRPMPGRTEPNTLWLVEMFANPRQDKFAVLRAEQRQNNSDAKADQTLYVLFQDVNRTTRNIQTISEFCDANNRSSPTGP
jgi:hypothetical protein